MRALTCSLDEQELQVDGPYQWSGPTRQEAKEIKCRLWPVTVDPRAHEKGEVFCRVAI
jgi:hypothetical protein